MLSVCASGWFAIARFYDVWFSTREIVRALLQDGQLFARIHGGSSRRSRHCQLSLLHLDDCVFGTFSWFGIQRHLDKTMTIKLPGFELGTKTWRARVCVCVCVRG